MDDDTKPKIDLMARVGELISRYAQGESIAGTSNKERHSTIIIASALLAIADELRSIYNVALDVRDANRAIGVNLAAMLTELEMKDGYVEDEDGAL